MDVLRNTRDRARSVCEYFGPSNPPSDRSRNERRRQSERSNKDTSELSISDITGSIDSFISGARASLSDFVDDIFVSDFKKKLSLVPEFKDEKRNSMKRRYRKLYSNPVCTRSNSPCYDENEELLENDAACDREKNLQENNDNACNKSFEREKSLKVFPLKIVKDTGFSDDNRAGEKVSQWVSSLNTNVGSEPILKATTSNGISPRRHYKRNFMKCNSDLTQRKFLNTMLNKEETERINSKSLQGIHLQPDWDRQSQNFGLCLYGTDSKPCSSNCITHLSSNTSDELDNIEYFHCKGHCLPVDESIRKYSEKLGSDKEQTTEIGNICLHSQAKKTVTVVGPDTRADSKVIGSVHILAHYNEQSNKLTLTIESISIDKLPGYRDDMLVFVKVEMKQPVQTKKKCSCVVKAKKTVFFKKEFFFGRKETIQGDEFQFNLTVYERRWQFIRKRDTPLAETMLFIDKNDVYTRKEQSAVLKYIVPVHKK